MHYMRLCMKVVLLLGSSTAGKSTLCKELVSKHNWKSVSSDEICEKIFKEQKPKINTEIQDELTKKDLFTKLQSFMSEEEVLELSDFGQLTISKGNHQLTKPIQFPNPDLPELEEVLKKAGFNESDIPELASDLRSVTKIGDTTNQKYQFSIPKIMDRLYDETYSQDQDASIILDLVPDQEGKYELFEHFEMRAQQYRDKNPGNVLTTYIVLAYCPPQKLSERINKRNKIAEESGNLVDKREGLFPFYQLASLTTVKSEKPDLSSDKISRDELFDIVDKHARTTGMDDSIFLENPVDYDALQQAGDNDEIQSSSFNKPRIGSKEKIEEYSRLTNQFGFFENQERAFLIIPNKEKYDAIINTSSGNPITLANELLQKLEEKPKACVEISKK